MFSARAKFEYLARSENQARLKIAGLVFSGSRILHSTACAHRSSCGPNTRASKPHSSSSSTLTSTTLRRCKGVISAGRTDGGNARERIDLVRGEGNASAERGKPSGD